MTFSMNNKIRPTWLFVLPLALLALAPIASAQNATNATTVATNQNIRFQFDGMPYAEVLERFASCCRAAATFFFAAWSRWSRSGLQEAR